MTLTRLATLPVLATSTALIALGFAAWRLADSSPTLAGGDVPALLRIAAGSELKVPEGDPRPHGTYAFEQKVEGRMVSSGGEGALAGLLPLAPSLVMKGELSVREEKPEGLKAQEGARVFLFALRPATVEFRQSQGSSATNFGLKPGQEFVARVTLGADGKIAGVEGNQGWPLPVTMAARDLALLTLRREPERPEMRFDERTARVCAGEATSLCLVKARYSWKSTSRGVVVAESTGALEIHRTSSEAKIAVGPTRLSRIDLFPSEEEMENAFAKNTLGNDTPDTLKAKIASLEERGIKEGAERAQLARKVVAVIRLYPETVPTFVELVRQSKEGTFSRLAVTGALAEVGNPEAQKGLLELAADTGLEESLRATVVGSMHHIKVPSAETVLQAEDLARRETSHFVRPMTRLLVGTLAGRLPEEASATKTEVLGRVVESMKEASSPEEVRFGLAVLGNAADEYAKAPASGRLSDPTPSIRAAAALALREVPGQDVDDLLVERFSSERESIVQESLLQALAYRAPRPEQVEKLAALSSASPEHAVRRTMLMALLKWRDDGLDVSATLERFLATEKTDSIRRLAANR